MPKCWRSSAVVDYETFCRIRDHLVRQQLTVAQTARALGLDARTVARWAEVEQFRARKAVLRASKLETDRVAYWWANRMLTSPRPLQEKMALFWHGHFATTEEKVRDYRKLRIQNEVLRPCPDMDRLCRRLQGLRHRPAARHHV